MKVSEICSRGVVSVTESASLRDVAALMAKHRVGTVVVISKFSERAVPVGIITDRDIVRAQLEHVADLSRMRVADVMARPPVTVCSEDTIGTAIEILRGRGIRRAPVVNAHGELIGLVSTDDLIGEVARQVSAMAQMLQRQPSRERHQA